MKKINIYFILLATIFFFRCESESKKWEESQKTNTIESYLKFIENYPKSQFIETANEKLHEAKINEALRLIGEPDEFILTPIDSLDSNDEYALNFNLLKLKEISSEISKKGLSNNLFENSVKMYSEYLRVKYWDVNIKKNSKKHFNIDNLKNLLGKEDETEVGFFKGKTSKFPLVWYKYGWIYFGVADNKNLEAIRGVFKVAQLPYIRLKNDSIIETATIEPQLFLFKTTDSTFYLFSSKSIKSIVRLPSSDLQYNPTNPLYEIVHDATKLVITHVSKEAYNRTDLISDVYKELEAQYNTSSTLGSKWYWGIAGGGPQEIGGVTYKSGVLNRGNLVSFTLNTLSIIDKDGNIKNIPISDFVSFFR